MAHLTLQDAKVIIDRLLESGLPGSTLFGSIIEAEREKDGAWTGVVSSATGITVFTTRSGQRLVVTVDADVCKRGDARCLCLVGFPSELQCPDCREDKDRDSYCVCGPKEDVE